jgi:hypothetical protein
MMSPSIFPNPQLTEECFLGDNGLFVAWRHGDLLTIIHGGRNITQVDASVMHCTRRINFVTYPCQARCRDARYNTGRLMFIQ